MTVEIDAVEENARRDERDLKWFLYHILTTMGYATFVDHNDPAIKEMGPRFHCDSNLKMDMLFFHGGRLKYYDPQVKESRILPEPIGVELKHATHISQLTKAIEYQIRGSYKDEVYHAGRWSGKIPIFALATDDSILRGHLYDYEGRTLITTPQGADAIDAFCARLLWRQGNAVLVRHENNLVLSYQDYYHPGNERHKWGQIINLGPL